MKAIRVYIGKSNTKCIYGRIYVIDITSHDLKSWEFTVNGKNFSINYKDFQEYYKDWATSLKKQINIWR